MWVPGSITFTVAMLVGFYRWLEPEEAPPTAPVLATHRPPPPPPVPEPESAPSPAALTT
jgi:hypothetical protein